MALRVSATCELKISQDNASNPQELTFSSGSKTLVDSATYSESSSCTFLVAAGATDTQIDLGSLSLASVMFILAKGSDLSVKLVPEGGALVSTQAYELIPNMPGIVPFKVEEVYVSNSGLTDQILILGAAGN